MALNAFISNTLSAKASSVAHCGTSAKRGKISCAQIAVGSWRSRCRRFAGAVIVALVAVAASGCEPLTQDEKLIAYGIGPGLADPGMADASLRLDAYFGYLCYQGNLPGSWREQQVPRCDYARFSSQEWTLLVSTGFNDIDRRCDAYLGWLNNKRRRQPALISQITDTRNFVAALLTAAGETGTPLAVVGQAFGFAASTFNNSHSRLLLEIEQSTVETIVMERRLAFREDMRNVRYANKPDTIYVLRSYLRLCMPFAIEAGINQVSRHGIVGTVPPQRTEPTRIAPTLLSRTTGIVQSGPPQSEGASRGRRRYRAIDTPPATRAPSQGNCQVKGAKPGYECRLIQSDVERMQSSLCIAPTGEFDGVTRSAIKQWENKQQGNIAKKNGIIDDNREFERILDNKC